MTNQEKKLLISCLESLHGSLASIGSLAPNYSKCLHAELDATSAKIEALRELVLKNNNLAVDTSSST